MYPTQEERNIRRIMLQQQEEIVSETMASKKSTLSVKEGFVAIERIQLELDILDKLDKLQELS